ncbi:MAG: chemotaxis protein CheW [Burkholderiaceae bacterium]
MIEAIAPESPASVLAENRSRLGVSIGEQHWLVNLSEAGEILPLPDSITPVPATKPWFQGVANIRGALYGVTDLSLFQGRHSIAAGKETRLLAFSESLGVNAAILITRMMGLQSMDEMIQEESVDSNGWAGKGWVDKAGVNWRELSLAKLARDEDFLSVNR